MMLESAWIEDIYDEVLEVETLDELVALYKDLAVDYPTLIENERLVEARQVMEARFAHMVPESSDVAALRAEVAELTKRLMEISAGQSAPAQGEVRTSFSRRYRLLSFEVKWSEKPQVLAIAKILEDNFKVGDVVDESEIVEVLVANERLLHTVQGAKKVWNFYKGDHPLGFRAHGNIEFA